MSCYCRNDTPCQPCLDGHYEDMARDSFNRAAALTVSVTVVDDRNWSPEDEDNREHDRKILADMSEQNVIFREAFTARDLYDMQKRDAKDWVN